jgi:hypothetical protein
MITNYIDPGTVGAVVGGSIWPVIAAAFAAIGAFLIKYFWNPLKMAIAKLRAKFDRNNKAATPLEAKVKA